MTADTCFRAAPEASASTADGRPLLAVDLEHVLDRAADDISDLRGGRVLITGATGFVGSWMLDTLLHADARLGLGVRPVVLVRDPRRLPARIAGDPRVTVVGGDVRSFHVAGAVDAVIHCATSSSAAYGRGDGAPRTMADTIVNGTARVLDIAASSGPVSFLQVSSGAVYGGPAAGVMHVREDAVAAPDPTDPRSAYAEGKRMAETLCAIAAATGGPACTIARCFTFLGPRLPLDAHFAAGNFVADALAGNPITVAGDGRAVRSYLYAADLAVWLWAVLGRGMPGRAYNVGAEHPVSILTLAQAVAVAGGPGQSIVVEGRDGPPAGTNAYVPSTLRARVELRLDEWIDLRTGLARTLAWHGGEVAA